MMSYSIKDKIYYTPDEKIFLYDGKVPKVLFGKSDFDSTTKVAFPASINFAVINAIGFKFDYSSYWICNSVKSEYCVQSKVFSSGNTSIHDFTVLRDLCAKQGVSITLNSSLFDAFSSHEA